MEKFGLQEIIQEQFLEYSQKLKILESEIIRKYREGEDYSKDVTKAAGLKMLKEECIRMLVEKKLTQK